MCSVFTRDAWQAPLPKAGASPAHSKMTCGRQLVLPSGIGYGVATNRLPILLLSALCLGLVPLSAKTRDDLPEPQTQQLAQGKIL